MFGKKDKLPDELKMKILNYLYFSDSVSNKMKSVNKSIKKYKVLQLESLISKYEITLLSYFVLKFFVYDEVNSVRLVLDYTMLTRSLSFQIQEMERIFKNLRTVDIIRIRKYIEDNGLSSEFYVD